jgi:putative hydrolase of the HAD superfamily
MEAVVRAVVFDLWQTLAAWPEEKSVELRRTWADALEVAGPELDELWHGEELYRLRETGPIAGALAALYERLGVEGDVGELLARRLELTREALVPVPGSLATLAELRQRGLALGLISNCTEEVALVWDESPFAGLFDVAVFSATAGCAKPDAAIYELALRGLGVPASESLFVGDGANDELAGAARAGMTPVLVQLDGPPAWNGLEDWSGLRIRSIPQVLELVA